jgi:hypothetical protein
MPPSITADGIGAAVMLSHGRQAYCGRMWRCTKNLAGVTSSCSLMSSLIAAALAADAGSGLVTVFDARQMFRQGLAYRPVKIGLVIQPKWNCSVFHATHQLNVWARTRRNLWIQSEAAAQLT